MKKLLCTLILSALLLVNVSGENAPIDEWSKSVYDRISLNDTLQTVTERFGVGEEKDAYLLFGDALCSFFESGRLQAKSRFYTDIHDLANLTHGDFTAAAGLKQGAEEKELIALLGEGSEVLVMNLSDEDDAGVRKLIAWKNAENTVLEALFELDDGKWVLFALGEIA